MSDILHQITINAPKDKVHAVAEQNLGTAPILHRAWKETGPFLAHCSTQWATFLLSLRDFGETGHGRPFPSPLRI